MTRLRKMWIMILMLIIVDTLAFVNNPLISGTIVTLAAVLVGAILFKEEE